MDTAKLVGAYEYIPINLILLIKNSAVVYRDNYAVYFVSALNFYYDSQISPYANINIDSL
jgi:hypothetical protein